MESSLDDVDHGVDHDHDEACMQTMPTGKSKYRLYICVYVYVICSNTICSNTRGRVV